MKLSQIVAQQQLKFLNTEAVDTVREINGCYIGDLLSNVMAQAQTGNIWLTVQIHQNVVAVAQLLNLGAIVFVEGNLPQEETMEKAQKEKIPLLSTTKSAFELAAGLHSMGLGR
jgi:hypothetical protein